MRSWDLDTWVKAIASFVAAGILLVAALFLIAGWYLQRLTIW